MTPLLPSPLPPLDRALLRSLLRMVPASDRSDWHRCWQAELWHRRHPQSGTAHSAADLYPGLLCDAFWLRKECWRRALTGTAVLCLVTLTVFAVVALLPLLAYFGDLNTGLCFLIADFLRFLIEAMLTTIVGFAFASQITEHADPHAPAIRFRAHLFLAAKLTLVQILAYLLSLDVSLPFLPRYRFAAEILQPQIYTVLALLALRWSFYDQNTRCRQCLRSLSAPLRVGRPSWNFLDSNGTHLACPDGHGLLNVPEFETSWRQSSEWIAQ